MAELTLANSPSSVGRIVAALPPFGRTILRCREANVAAISSQLRLKLPRQACRSHSKGSRYALWLGPDEWLLLQERISNSEALTTQLANSPCSAVDISHRQVAIGIKGNRAEELLNVGCPLDLAIAAFPVGACTRTIFHKAEIVLWRTGTDQFHIEVWRSFAPYVEALLVEAERN